MVLPVFEREFLAAYDRYADAIFRFCYFRVFERERARELAQETFTRAWGALVDGHDIQNLRAFLYTTARHLVIDEARRRRRVTISLDEIVEQGGDPVDDRQRSAEERLMEAQALAGLDCLSDDDRELLLLRYVDGFPPREIVAMLGVSANVISVRLHRARQRFGAAARADGLSRRV